MATKKNCLNCQKEFEGSRKTFFCSEKCEEEYDSSGIEVPILEEEKELNGHDKNIQLPQSIIIPKKSFPNNTEKLKELRAVNEKINKDFGAGTVMMFGDKPDTDYQVISTGSFGLDIALGIGGLPRGRIVEIVGWESSGKSTIALNVIADAQKQGLLCSYIDAENSYDPAYAEILGVNNEQLCYSQPDYGEQALEIADRQITTGLFGVVVIDSVAALVPKSELEGEMGDNKMGQHARLMSQACRKITGVVSKTNTLCIFINQFRHKIGAMYESPDVPTGGNALKFYASIRLQVSRSLSAANSVMNGDVKEGNQTTVKVIKNKCSPPFTSAKFDIIYGKGINRLGEIVDIATQQGIIKKSGSWYSYHHSKLGQGESTVAEVLENHPDMLKEIEAKITKP